MASPCAPAMTAFRSWGEIGLGEEADAASYELTCRSRPRLRPDPYLRTAPSAALPGDRGSSSPPRRGERWTMPDCFCVPGAGARCSSARAAIGASSTAERAAAASPEANRCARRDAGISNRDAAGTVMPSASGATAAGAAKGPFGKMTHHGSASSSRGAALARLRSSVHGIVARNLASRRDREFANGRP